MKKQQQPPAQLVSIPQEQLPQYIGKLIHLRWASRGCTWRLLRIEGEVIFLETPKTHKPLTAKASDAMYTRQHQPKTD